MQLTTHTDYALRTLLVLGRIYPHKMRTREIGDVFDISENHLLKVIQTLSRLDYVATIRGKKGGVRLALALKDINIGQVIRSVENDLGVVPCLKKDGQECFITPVCGLKGLLHEATALFLQHLDQYTLEDLLSEKRAHGGLALQRRLSEKLPTRIRVKRP